jgi:flavin reductase (DIM6/NTAB) family NADH-FMN oxidoreductase RutF
MTSRPPVVSQQLFRTAMAEICTPVSVISADDHGVPHGTTVSAFSSLSLDPPMILIAMDRTSDLLAIIRGTRRFGVNILAHGAESDARAFARKGDDSFAGVSWQWHEGLPRLHHTVGWLDCSVHEMLDGGDHVIVTALVSQAEVSPSPPLVYHSRRFGTHSAYAPRARQ